jgi:hypothetical protein
VGVIHKGVIASHGVISYKHWQKKRVVGERSLAGGIMVAGPIGIFRKHPLAKTRNTGVGEITLKKKYFSSKNH